MKTFTDATGEKWVLQLTLGKARQIAGAIGLDILIPLHFQRISESITDRMAYVFLLCEEQARERKLNADDFEERLYGDGVIEGATEALLGEFATFARKLGQPALAKLAEKQIETSRVLGSRLAGMVESGEIDSLLDQSSSEITEAMNKLAGSSSPSSPRSPVSTGDR